MSRHPSFESCCANSGKCPAHHINSEDTTKSTPQKRWMSAIHPDDLVALTKAIESAPSGALFSQDCRVITNEEIRWLYGRGKFTLDRNGVADRFTGAIVDITQKRPTTYSTV
jgi:hypothetical protein